MARSGKPYPGMGRYVLLLKYGEDVVDRGAHKLDNLIEHARRLPAGWNGRCKIIDQNDPAQPVVWER